MAPLFEILNGKFLFNIEESEEGHSNDVIRISATQDRSAVILTFFLQCQKIWGACSYYLMELVGAP